MHTTSGLLDELAGGTTLADAQAQVLDYIREWVPDPGKAPLAGNSVGTDKAFLDRDMAELVGYLHYRVIDVSSIKELARRWYPRVYFASPRKNGGHRALADILESIDELRYYRAALLPAQPGPGLGGREEDRRRGRRDVGEGRAAARGLRPGGGVHRCDWLRRHDPEGYALHRAVRVALPTMVVLTIARRR